MNELEGAHLVNDPDIAGALTIDKVINAVVGATATLLTRPTGARILVLQCEGTNAVFRLRPGDYLPKTFTADSTTDLLTATAHGYVTGDGPFQISNSGGGLPGGLAASTNYWVIKVGVDTFKMATSYNNALLGTPIDLTSNGTGTQTIGGLANAAPGSTTSDGYAAARIGSGETKVLAAPKKMTVRGTNVGDILLFWWN